MTDYTTLATIRSFGSFVSTGDDALLSAMITAASGMIDNYCGRVFATASPTDRTFYKDDGRFAGDTLHLDEDLAEAAVTISDDPTVRYLPSNSFPAYAIVLTDGSWADPTVVNGYWGYTKTTAPDDIQIACLRLTKWLYELRETTQGTAVVVTPDGQVLLPQGLPDDVKSILAPYRKVVVA